MARVVLDTNVVVSACLTPEGAPATIVELALLGAFTLCLSPAVLAKYREVLAREKFSREQERVRKASTTPPAEAIAFCWLCLP